MNRVATYRGPGMSAAASFNNTAKAREAPSFDIQRSYAVLGLVSIVAMGWIYAAIVQVFLTDELIRREAEVSLEFIQGVAMVNDPSPYFQGDESAAAALKEWFQHITLMPGVLRANVYAPDGRIVWSDEPSMIGRRFAENPGVQLAARGTLVYELEERGSENKREHAYLPANLKSFLESYLPVRGSAGHVVGVVEIYRATDTLFRTIRDGQRLVVITTLIGCTLLYATLFGLVRRAAHIIERQQRMLLGAETLAAVGEMAASVAHSIRNPLASIRTSAELIADPETHEPRESYDIMEEVDRLEGWVREMLSFAQAQEQVSGSASLEENVQRVCEETARRRTAQQVELHIDVPSGLPLAQATPSLIHQVLVSIVGNALDAMLEGGSLTIAVRYQRPTRTLEIAVRDTGPGINADHLDEVFKPFYTSKAHGLGLGLPLVRRILERIGGAVELENWPEGGTTARIFLPAVR